MSSYFKTIEEQINILKSRGLVIENEEYAKDILLRYNYYKIINGTYKFLIDKETNMYKKGTNFNDLVDLHEFDKELKKILISAMLEIERISRSIISYKFVEKYPQPGAYLNPKNYDSKDIEYVNINIERMQESIQKFEEEKNYNRSIKYYLSKYNSVPFWFIVNFMTFGNIINIYDTFDYSLKEKIADEFQKFVEENIEKNIDGHLTPSQLESFLKNAKDIRNICAHDNLILDFEFNTIEYFSVIHEVYNIKPSDKRNRLFDTVVVLQALLPKNYYVETEMKIKLEIQRLKENVDESVFENVMQHIGYKRG
ncbi:Abi family protein [Helcococcus bovis]|uniref:Abi family protein n=1 Tax=Helcococcus bovis TaxID=3153252 RepID=UPI0038BBC12E